MSELTYRVIEESDTAKVATFISEQFFKDEPVCKSQNFVPGKSMIDKCIETIPLKCNTIAEDSEGNIAGVRMAIPRVANETRKMSDDKHDIMNLYTFIDDSIEDILFKEMKIEKGLIGLLLSVDQVFRGQGVGLKLYSENMALAKSLGYDAYICECTSLFSAKICEKLSMTKVYALKYSDHVDEDGKPLFAPEPPHDSAIVYIQRL